MADEVQTIGGNAQEKLRSYARRLNSLLDQKADLADDTKELMKEVKGDGFETKVLNEAAKRMRADQAAREEFEAKVDLYTHAIQGDMFDADYSDTSVTITGGGQTVETTIGGMKRATERMAKA